MRMFVNWKIQENLEFSWFTEESTLAASRSKRLCQHTENLIQRNEIICELSVNLRHKINWEMFSLHMHPQTAALPELSCCLVLLRPKANFHENFPEKLSVSCSAAVLGLDKNSSKFMSLFMRVGVENIARLALVRSCFNSRKLKGRTSANHLRKVKFRHPKGQITFPGWVAAAILNNLSTWHKGSSKSS